MFRVPGMFLTGNTVCVADFKLYVFLCKLRAVDEDLKPLKSLLTNDLLAYMASIESLPNVSAYRSESTYLTRPFHNLHAKWNP
jgi:hypothetical protein